MQVLWAYTYIQHGYEDYVAVMTLLQVWPYKVSEVGVIISVKINIPVQIKWAF
jgi:hypothetical protein